MNKVYENTDVIKPFRPKVHNHLECISEAITAADLLCEKEGLTFTPLRRKVLELVWSSHGSITAYELLEGLRETGRKAAPPTVYRALEFLLENGLIHRIESLNAYVGCGDPKRRHGGQFLICQNCKTVAELDDNAIARAVISRADSMGFTVHQQTVEVIGKCAECAAGSEKAL